jgi:hypothetical protein
MTKTDQTKESAGLIFRKIPKIMGLVGAIGKDRRNAIQNYAFRGIDDMYNALNEHMASEGVFCVPEVVDDKSETFQTKDGKSGYRALLTMCYTFYAEDGSFVTCTVKGEATDYSDKATNKAMSAAQKYAFLQIFCIPTEEPKDSENDSPPVPPESAVKPTGDNYTSEDYQNVDPLTGEVHENVTVPPKVEGNVVKDAYGNTQDKFGNKYIGICDICGSPTVMRKTTDGREFAGCINYKSHPPKR